MFVIKLANGNLLVPEAATARSGHVIGDAYVEIDPADPDYAAYAADALTQEEVDQRKARWRDGDEPLRRQFLEFLARGADDGTPGPA